MGAVTDEEAHATAPPEFYESVHNDTDKPVRVWWEIFRDDRHFIGPLGPFRLAPGSTETQGFPCTLGPGYVDKPHCVPGFHHKICVE